MAEVRGLRVVPLSSIERPVESLRLEPLATYPLPPEPRRLQTTSILDFATGGGLVLGSSTLLAGAPGAGKSTILLEAACAVSSALYFSGEEPVEAVAWRAERLGVRALSSVRVAATDDADAVAEAIGDRCAPLCIVDSVQTMRVRGPEGRPNRGQVGSPSQVRAVVELIAKAAQRSNTAVVFVCHETKAGGIAGPRAVEHLVDTVLRFEREPSRCLVTVKNRHGPAPLRTSVSMGPDGRPRVVPAGIIVRD